MRKPSFWPTLLFSTIFVYTGTAVADSTDFYEQLRKTKDFSPAKVEELKKKTIDQDRIQELNSRTAATLEANKKSEKEVDNSPDEKEDVTPTIPVSNTTSAPGTYIRKKGSPAFSSGPEVTAPPLKVNAADFPEDIDFGSPKIPAKGPIKTASPAPK